MAEEKQCFGSWESSNSFAQETATLREVIPTRLIWPARSLVSLNIELLTVIQDAYCLHPSPKGETCLKTWRFCGLKANIPKKTRPVWSLSYFQPDPSVFSLGAPWCLDLNHWRTQLFVEGPAFSRCERSRLPKHHAHPEVTLFSRLSFTATVMEKASQVGDVTLNLADLESPCQNRSLIQGSYLMIFYFKFSCSVYIFYIW